MEEFREKFDMEVGREIMLTSDWVNKVHGLLGGLDTFNVVELDNRK